MRAHTHTHTNRDGRALTHAQNARDGGGVINDILDLDAGENILIQSSSVMLNISLDFQVFSLYYVQSGLSET